MLHETISNGTGKKTPLTSRKKTPGRWAAGSPTDPEPARAWSSGSGHALKSRGKLKRVPTTATAQHAARGALSLFGASTPSFHKPTTQGSWRLELRRCSLSLLIEIALHPKRDTNCLANANTGPAPFHSLHLLLYILHSHLRLSFPPHLQLKLHRVSNRSVLRDIVVFCLADFHSK